MVGLLAPVARLVMGVTSIVIFGTGSNGERAWQAAAACPDIHVVCFADNDAAKQGTNLHGRRVIAPSALASTPFDFIVIASMFAADIRRQLDELGLPSERVVSPLIHQFHETLASLPAKQRTSQPLVLDDGSTMTATELPHVLVLTHETLNGTHGTGVLLKRLFADFPPEHLFSLSHTANGDPWLPQSVVLPSIGSRRERVATLTQQLRRTGCAPGLVYATAFSEPDLTLLQTVLDALPQGTPVIQHFMDYMPHEAGVFDARFMTLSPRISEIWALTGSMAEELHRRFGRAVRHVSALHQELSASFKRDHRPFGAEFRTVMVGNLWQPDTLPLLRRVWAMCLERIPGLAPIEWYVHPTRVQALIDGGWELGDEIVWRGYYAGRALSERLASADLALLPFNADRQAQAGYARYSLPSRLTELCGAGLPIVAIASRDTEPAGFLESHGCGLAVAGSNESAVASVLTQVIRDQVMRQRMGVAARRVAEEDFAIGPFRQWLLGTLVRMVRSANAAAAPAALLPIEMDRTSEPAVAIDATAFDRIHYACGRNVLSDWLNVDGFDQSYPGGNVPPELARQILRTDLTGPHPFPDDHFRFGYCEDFIEHIDQSDLASFLCESYRTFKPGGVLRLSSPGLDGILRRHLRGADWQAAQVLRDEAYTQWQHKHFVCFEELDRIARHVGWRLVRRCDYGVSDVPGLSLDTRHGQADLNLVVELVK